MVKYSSNVKCGSDTKVYNCRYKIYRDPVYITMVKYSSNVHFAVVILKCIIADTKYTEILYI